MRRLALAVFCIACNGSKAEAPPRPAPKPAATEGNAAAALSGKLDNAPAAPGAKGLEMERVTLLQTQDVVGARSETESLAAGLKAIAETVLSHPEGLPDQLDAVVGARPSLTKIWLVSERGEDINAPALAAELAKLPPIPVRADVIALAIRFVRSGTAKSEKQVFLPASWKATAKKEDSFTSVDMMVERVLPPK